MLKNGGLNMIITAEKDNKVEAKPFVKWAGGKTQLLQEIDDRLPRQLKEGKITRYIEPFVGSGAVLFHLIQKYQIKEALIWDINPELITVYEVIKKDVNKLINILDMREKEFLSLEKEERKEYYYQVREKFNESLTDFNFNDYGPHKIERASQFIFLNRTCFNGLFRVNKSGHFNVPMGDYKNPTICNAENLLAVNRILQKVNINVGDYRESKEYVDSNTFVYFDPPYRPLSKSSNFTSYSKYDFGDKEQIELSDYFLELHHAGAKLMLSNSDPTNTNPDDDFFEKYYKNRNENFHIHKVSARRNINSKGSKRGEIWELLITNYDVPQE
jgi:DNA adenine methylase